MGIWKLFFACSCMTLAMGIVGIGCADDDDGGTGTDADTDSDTDADADSDTDTDADGGTECTVDLQDYLGVDDTCWDCMAESCCAEAETFDATPSVDAWVALDTCVSETCRANEDTDDDCAYPMCSVALLAFQECAACQDEHCCEEFQACASDSGCLACGSLTDTTQCCVNEAHLAWAACTATNCAAECQACYECNCPAPY